ncbi:MAG: hypothetical protein WBD24_05525, partial [Candidatus Omnitrophota bacterium]
SAVTTDNDMICRIFNKDSRFCSHGINSFHYYRHFFRGNSFKKREKSTVLATKFGTGLAIKSRTGLALFLKLV